MQASRANSREFLPNLFVLGAAKCGTSTLHAYLADMPDVCMSDPKEPFFFERDFHEGLEFYRARYYKHWQGEPIVGESRHRNLYLPYVPERIHQTNPKAKLVVVVRNPIERAYSHWWHWYRRGQETLAFEEAIRVDFERIRNGLRISTREEIVQHCNSLFPSGQGIYRTYLDSGYYWEQLARYLRLFPAQQIKVILFRDLVSKPQSVVGELREFLALERLPANEFEGKAVNLSPFPDHRWVIRIYKKLALRRVLPRRLKELGRPVLRRYFRRRAMSHRTREWLLKHYSLHNRRLEDLLGVSLEHWK